MYSILLKGSYFVQFCFNLSNYLFWRSIMPLRAVNKKEKIVWHWRVNPVWRILLQKMNYKKYRNSPFSQTIKRCFVDLMPFLRSLALLLNPRFRCKWHAVPLSFLLFSNYKIEWSIPLNFVQSPRGWILNLHTSTSILLFQVAEYY